MNMNNYHLGIPDEEFLRGEAPMTKEEVRILTIAKARINPEDIVLDIGAGTGSLSIEASFLAKEVYAIERNKVAYGILNDNIEKFARTNIIPILGEAPTAIPKELKQIDLAIIGGSGKNLPTILQTVDQLLSTGGRLVANAITIETLSTVLEYLKNNPHYTYSACCLQVSRLNQVGSYNMLAALNPVYIISACKK